MTSLVYIGGLGRSGTTLLDRLLGQVDGFCSAGEVVHLWRRGLQLDERCGCGQAFSRCPFWTDVGNEAFGGWAQVDAAGMLALQARVDRTRFVPAMLAPGVKPGFSAELASYAGQLGRLYAAIQVVSGKEAVIDSSKHASTAYLLRSVPGIDLKLVHLVRDSHAVAFSWTKVVERPEVVSAVDYMPLYGPARVGARWISQNLLLQALVRLGVPSIFVRYEELVTDPKAELRRILALVKGAAPLPAMDFVGNATVELSPGHLVAGNPMRFHQGPTPLRVDEEWRARMRLGPRVAVSALTWPLLAGYGYGRP